MNIIDIVLIVLIVVIVIASAKKGFVASCLDAFSLAISGFASYKLCEPASQMLYDLFIGDLIKTEFRQVLDDVSSSLPIKDKIVAMLQALPESAIKLAESKGSDISSLSSAVSGAFVNDDALIETVANNLGQRVMLPFTEIVVFIILFILFTLLVRFMANFFSNNLEKIPVVGQLDTVLGGALGLIKGAVIVVALSVLLYIIGATSESGSPMEAIGSSQIYMFLVENNPIIDVIRGN